MRLFLFFSFFFFRDKVTLEIFTGNSEFFVPKSPHYIVEKQRNTLLGVEVYSLLASRFFTLDRKKIFLVVFPHCTVA